MAKSLEETIKTYITSLHSSTFGQVFDLNQESSLKKAVSWFMNHYLKVKENELDSSPTKEAIEAARYFNTKTNTYYASARNDRVIVSLVPKVAKTVADQITPSM